MDTKAFQISGRPFTALTRLVGILLIIGAIGGCVGDHSNLGANCLLAEKHLL
jgi:hypothetical protein